MWRFRATFTAFSEAVSEVAWDYGIATRTFACSDARRRGIADLLTAVPEIAAEMLPFEHVGSCRGTV
jgi:hypothetical protein